MSLAEANSQVHQFLATRYSTIFEESLALVVEEVAFFNLLADDPDG